MKIYAALAMILLAGSAAGTEAVDLQDPSFAQAVFYVQ